MVFWITYPMKAKREQVDDKLMVIKLFTSNYVRDIYRGSWRKIKILCVGSYLDIESNMISR